MNEKLLDKTSGFFCVWYVITNTLSLTRTNECFEQQAQFIIHRHHSYANLLAKGHLGSSGFRLSFSRTNVLMQVFGRSIVLGKGRLVTGLVRLPSFSHDMMAERS